MFSRNPQTVTKININVADCTVSHTYLEHNGSLNIFIEPKQEPIYPGPDRVMNPLLTQVQPPLTPSNSTSYTPSHPPSNLNTQTDMTQQNYFNDQDQDNQQIQDTDQSQDSLFSPDSGLQLCSPPTQDYQTGQDQTEQHGTINTPPLSLNQDVPPAIPGPSYSPISDTEQDINDGIDAAKILWHIKTKSSKIPFEGTCEQMAFLSQPQQPQKVTTYKPAPKSK